MRVKPGGRGGTAITAAIVAEIERLLADGEPVPVVAAQLRVPPSVVDLIREDRSRPPAPQMPKTIHRTRPARTAKRKHTVAEPPGFQLEEGEQLADVPERCPGCGGLLAVAPCRICRARRRRLMRGGG